MKTSLLPGNRSRQAAGPLAIERLGAEQFYLPRQPQKRGPAALEFTGESGEFYIFEQCRGCVGAYVCARSFGVMRQPLAGCAILAAYGCIEQPNLFGRVVHQGGQDLAHEFGIIQRDVPEPLAIERYWGFNSLHFLIVAPGRRNWYRRYT